MKPSIAVAGLLWAANLLLASVPAIVAPVAFAPALAQDVRGTWINSTGKAKVRIGDCGSSLCGVIAWVRDRDDPAKVGQRVFSKMKQTKPNTWVGSAFNPEDGKTYSGTMTLSGNRLATAGCALGGLICRTVYWSRAR